MDIVTLRKLTKKSLVPYGMYKGHSVGTLLQTRKDQIAYLYYNVEWITFTDEILEEMHIKGGWEIKKPGTDRHKYLKRKRALRDWKYGDKAGLVAYHAQRRRAKKAIAAAEKKEILSKAQLMAINHGHKKA